MFEYPSKAMRDKYQATGTPFLSGFESDAEDGYSSHMNFILSNGDRSTQREEDDTTDYYDHMMPADAHNKIRSVTIYQKLGYIGGFSFFDKDGALLWEIGYTDTYYKETVEIAENERIIGVKAKLIGSYQSVYSDFQFQIGKFV